jgi:hypothetical protein
MGKRDTSCLYDQWPVSIPVLDEYTWKYDQPLPAIVAHSPTTRRSGLLDQLLCFYAETSTQKQSSIFFSVACFHPRYLSIDKSRKNDRFSPQFGVSPDPRFPSIETFQNPCAPRTAITTHASPPRALYARTLTSRH